MSKEHVSDEVVSLAAVVRSGRWNSSIFAAWTWIRVSLPLICLGALALSTPPDAMLHGITRLHLPPSLSG